MNLEWYIPQSFNMNIRQRQQAIKKFRDIVRAVYRCYIGEEKGPRVQGVEDSRGKNKTRRVRGFKGSRIQGERIKQEGFEGPRIQGFKCDA
jgi:hypothetical protein